MTSAGPAASGSPDDPGTDAPRDRPLSGREPVDVLLDLVVFAPIGLAVESRRLLAAGRHEAKRRVEEARAVGSFVVPMVRKNGWSLLASMLGAKRDTERSAAPSQQLEVDR